MSALRKTTRAQDRERGAQIEECQERGVPVARFAEPFHSAMESVASGELSDATGVSPSRILHYSTERSDTVDAVMRIASALDVLGHPEMLDEANRLAGRVTFRLHNIEGPMTANVMQALADDMKRGAEFVEEVALTMRDGEVSPTEMERVERRLVAQIAAGKRTVALLRRAMERGQEEASARDSKKRSVR